MAEPVVIEGLHEVIADMTAASGKAQRHTWKALYDASVAVRDDARGRVAGLAHAPLYPASITYDMKIHGSGLLESEIGPDKGKPQGALGNLINYGSAKNAPIEHLDPALAAAVPKFVQDISGGASPW